MKSLKSLVIVGGMLSFTLAGCSGEIVSTSPPNAIIETYPAPPAPRYVWVPGHYVARGGNYVWRNGYYQLPPRGRTVWVSPRYDRVRRGYMYRKGYWKR